MEHSATWMGHSRESTSAWMDLLDSCAKTPKGQGVKGVQVRGEGEPQVLGPKALVIGQLVAGQQVHQIGPVGLLKYLKPSSGYLDYPGYDF